jgi:energy-converting hydrogenase B subunit G
MNLYDLIRRRIKEIQGEAQKEEPISNISTSSILTAEMTLISTLLIAAVTLRFVSRVLMIFVVLALIFMAIIVMPIMPKLKREQNDSLASMTFYVILALGIVTVLFYWGNLNV